MRISRFFIDRPIFASVLSIIFIILGGVSFIRLPIAQYPEIAPPIINVSGQYPGANAEVVATTVVAPIEEQINGVENMLYMSSNATADGRFSIAVTFDIGTNLDIAQVQVQNRVGIAQPRLPPDVRNIGVTVAKSSPDLMMVVHLFSPDQSRDALFVSNYATLEIKDALTRVDGVGSITVFGSRDYAMRIWLDPGRLQALGMTANDVTQALQAQNIQVASGVLNQPPVEKPGAFQIAVQTLGRLANPDEFANIVVKQSAGAVVRLKDVANIQLAAQDYSSNSYLGRSPAVAIAIFQRPGSNALATADAIVKTMDGLSKRFPPGVQHAIVYNPTEFIRQSVNAVIETILEAALLVVLVIIIFLQTWRAAVIPIIAIPVSLIGTFFFMATFGFTLNNLTLFGTGARGRHRGRTTRSSWWKTSSAASRTGSARATPRSAAWTRSAARWSRSRWCCARCSSRRPSSPAFRDSSTASSPCTIAGATIVSCTVSLTLSPALCALLLKPHDPKHRDRWWEVPIHGFFRLFNFGFDGFARGYGWIVGKVVRLAAIMLIVYAGVLATG
jgi:hydrophobe/amphiphile efflux-1 (HAE1) family protein